MRISDWSSDVCSSDLSGTSGGILAPLLIIGGAFGGLIGLVLPGGPGPWAMIGMTGVMAAAMRAPLTAALFAVELTGQFDALPAPAATAGGAYAVAVLGRTTSIKSEEGRGGQEGVSTCSSGGWSFHCKEITE